MRLFLKSFAGDAGFWFLNLKDDSIGSWEELHDVFLKYWGKNKSYDQFLSEFYILKRKSDDPITKFNWRFQSFYISIPTEIRPSVAAAMISQISKKFGTLLLNLSFLACLGLLDFTAISDFLRMIAKRISLCWCCLLWLIVISYPAVRICWRWIGTTVNYAYVVAEVQLNEDPIQSVIFQWCAFFLFYYQCPCSKTVETLVLCSTVISDDRLRAPWWMFQFFSIPVSFVSQGLSLFCFAVVALEWTNLPL